MLRRIGLTLMLLVLVTSAITACGATEAEPTAAPAPTNLWKLPRMKNRIAKCFAPQIPMGQGFGSGYGSSAGAAFGAGGLGLSGIGQGGGGRAAPPRVRMGATTVGGASVAGGSVRGAPLSPQQLARKRYSPIRRGANPHEIASRETPHCHKWHVVASQLARASAPIDHGQDRLLRQPCRRTTPS